MSAKQGDVAVVAAGGGERWADAATWAGDGIKREVFFFRSGECELYGSIYAADSPPPSFGLVVCNSWGYEANLNGFIVHPLSIAAAHAGGVALNFHYPGFGDSEGDADATTVDAMAGAAADAVREAARRHPGVRWILVGLMLGASVAALAAARERAVERLLLLQPALRPGQYFARLERASKRSLGGAAPAPAPEFAYGYRLAPALLEAARAGDAEVEAALRRFERPGTVVRYEKPDSIEGVPAQFEQVVAPGSWRFGARNNPELTIAAASWLRGRLTEGV